MFEILGTIFLFANVAVLIVGMVNIFNDFESISIGEYDEEVISEYEVLGVHIDTNEPARWMRQRIERRKGFFSEVSYKDFFRPPNTIQQSIHPVTPDTKHFRKEE